jgi:hypothetical protein
LNTNIIPKQANFLRKLKKNKCLSEIMLNKTSINDDNTNEIMRLISNTQLETIYLYKNKISNFNDCLRIIGRTKLIKIIEDEKDVKKDTSFLFNLDLSDNPCLNLNTSKIDILRSLINDTNLFCLDLAHILLGTKPKDLQDSQENSKYRTEVNKLSEYLNKQFSMSPNNKINILKNFVKVNENIRPNNNDYCDNIDPIKLFSVRLQKDPITICQNGVSKHFCYQNNYYDDIFFYKDGAICKMENVVLDPSK